MQVRLAFSVMVHTDPDVMLIDEVLAVGDAAFQQKCLDVFYRLKTRARRSSWSRTQMGLVEQFCHRAMMLSDGDIKIIGAPHEVGRAYLTENFATARHATSHPTRSAGERARVLEMWVTDEHGERSIAVQYGEACTLHMERGGA